MTNMQLCAIPKVKEREGGTVAQVKKGKKLGVDNLPYLIIYF